MRKKAAVFLDRDGTIIEDRGHLKSPDEAHVFDDTIESLRLLACRFELFIVTHQPGVSRGLLTMDEVNRVNAFILDILDTNGISIREVYVCPHERSEGCRCIKPQPYFLMLAANDYTIDLERSYAIGDHPHDVELARNAGATGIYVQTGHGEKHLGDLRNDAVVTEGIGEAARYVIDDYHRRFEH
jgi:D-glycero-D-manno-heptose 1,7-bisphosphate phosphatase